MQKNMMIYSMRDFDELPLFHQYAADFTLHHTSEKPTLENLYLAEGCPYVNVITTPVDRAMLTELKRLGCHYIVTRTIGYDHIDIHAARELGIRVANTPYGPDGVAEYTILLLLMCLRKVKSIRQRFSGQDFTLKGLMGKELSDMTVGVVGTGRIGTRLCEMLTGFGCRILAYSPHPNETVGEIAEYVSLSELYAQSDVISFHAPSTADTFHMVNQASLAQMKDGVILINTARGSLLDTQAILDGLDSGKIGGAGLDVVEDELHLYYYDCREEPLHNRGLALLNSYPNVVVTHHMAFYTKQSIETMVRDSLKGAMLDAIGQENPWRVV